MLPLQEHVETISQGKTPITTMIKAIILFITLVASGILANAAFHVIRSFFKS